MNFYVFGEYIWTKSIEFGVVFNLIESRQYDEDADIPYKTLFDLNQLYLGIKDEQKASFISSLVIKFKALERIEDGNQEVASGINLDDLPF